MLKKKKKEKKTIIQGGTISVSLRSETAGPESSPTGNAPVLFLEATTAVAGIAGGCCRAGHLAFSFSIPRHRPLYSSSFHPDPVGSQRPLLQGSIKVTTKSKFIHGVHLTGDMKIQGFAPPLKFFSGPQEDQSSLFCCKFCWKQPGLKKPQGYLCIISYNVILIETLVTEMVAVQKLFFD